MEKNAFLKKLLNDRRIRKIEKELSFLAYCTDNSVLITHEKDLAQMILSLSDAFKQENSELTQPLHLYFAGLYYKGRMSLDKSAHNESIELFTKLFLKNKKKLQARFYYNSLQKVLQMLILANLSIHRVQHATKLLNKYLDIFTQTYRARLYIRILSSTCGSLDIKRISDLFDSARDAYEKECVTLESKVSFVKNLYIISKGTFVESEKLDSLVKDVCVSLAGSNQKYASDFFKELSLSNEYLEEIKDWLDSLANSNKTEGVEEVDYIYNRLLKGDEEIPIFHLKPKQDSSNKEYPLDSIIADLDKTKADFNSTARKTTDLNEKLTASKEYFSLELMRPSIEYWRDFESNYLKVSPQKEDSEKVFFFVNEYSLVNGAVSFPFFLEARRRGIKCYSISPRIHMDTADPEEEEYNIYGYFSNHQDVRYYYRKDSIDAENIDIANKRIIVDGMNVYQPIFEFVTRYQFTYDYKYDTDAWARYRTIILARHFYNLFSYIKKIERWAVANNKSVYFVSNAPHLHNAAAFRIYCEEEGYKNGLNYICTSPGYDNYFANATDPRSETTTALNLTRNLYSRNSFLGTKEGFEKYYEANRNRIEEIRNKMQVHLEAQRGRNRQSQLSEEKARIEGIIRRAKESGKTIILLNGKVIIDLAVKYTKGCVHSDMSDWITHAVEFSGKHSDDILLLIKPHPHENREDLTLTSEKIDNLRSLIKCELQDNTIYLDNDMFTNHELINYMDLGVVWNGTSALEFAAQGKKVLIADVWGHYDYPIGFVFPESLEEYESYMLDPSLMKERDDLQDRAITFLEYMGSDDVRIKNNYSKTTLMNFNQYESTINGDAVDAFVAHGDKALESYFDSIL